MNMLVDGEWRTRTFQATNEDGEFERGETVFRNAIRDDPDARFQPEAGRYHLYVSYACPWAHRTLLVRSLTGLEGAISVDVVDPDREAGGWRFTPEKAGCTPDTVNGSDYLREVYQTADDDVTCRVTVPVLWDRKEETIVNNESEEILRMLDTEMGEVAERDVDLYPESYQDDVDRIIEEIYEPINNGVYRAAFAESQAAYDRAVETLFSALDRWDSVLADQRYLAGDRLTEADICMFTTLVRFDQVYHTTPTTLRGLDVPFDDYREDDWKRLTEYEHLHAYLRDLYQTDGVAETVHLDHIAEHYGSPGSPDGFDPYELGEVDLKLDEPHNRGRLSAKPLR